MNMTSRPEGVEHVISPEGLVLASSSHPHPVARDVFGFVALMAAELPAEARNTLWLFSGSQGRTSRPMWGEERGKIPHEIVVQWKKGGAYLGLPVARGGRIVSYFAADATAEFVIAAAVADAAGYAGIVRDLGWCFSAAGEYLLTELGRGGGLVRWSRDERYRGTGLEAQCWRDAASMRRARAAGVGCILRPDGTPPRAPVADWETQAVTLVALRALYRLLNDDRYRLAAVLLERRIQHDFDPGTLALEWGEDADRPVPGAGSQSGVLLWAGALSGAKAEAAARRLLEDDITTSWGVRTLSRRSPLHDPFRTRWGRVYAFNAYLAACGLRALGLDAEAAEMAAGIANAIDRIGDYPACWAVTDQGEPRSVGSHESGSAWAIAVRHAIDAEYWHTAAGLCERIDD